MIDRRRFSAGLLASSLPMPALAQAATGSGGGGKGGDVVMAQQAQPPTLDAQTTTAQASRNITLHIFETLFARDEAGAAKPDLAEGVDVSSDGLTYRFTLRTDVKFHNGKPMTSADVKASLERYARVGGTAAAMKMVAAIEAPDARTVVVKLSTVYSGFLVALSDPISPRAIMPEEECAKPAGQAAAIGTGPYKLVEYHPDSHVLMVRNDQYTANTNYPGRDGFAGRKTPYFDSVRIRFMPEGGARTAGLQTGEVQVLEALDIAMAKKLKDDPKIKTYTMMPWAFQTIHVNNANGLTANLEIRRAIQAALDLEEIMAISSGGLYRMDPAWQYPDTAYYAGIDGLDAYTRQDQAKAKQLLQKAGYKGEELVIIADSAFKNHLDTGVLAAQQLRAVGMQVKLNVMDWPTAMSTHNKADAWNLWPVMMGFLPADPYTEFGFFTGPSPMQLKPDAGLEEAQVKLANALSREEQIAAVKQFQMRMYEQVICIKCGDVGIVQATRANIVNYAPYRIPRMWDCWLT